MAEPFFSIVIPARNEEKRISECLEAIRGSLSPAETAEVILVDDHSDDQTVAIARRLGAQVIETDGRLSIAGLRNAGAARARGEVLVFLDADVVVTREWLRLAKNHFDRGFVGALGFAYSVPADAGWVGTAWGGRSLGVPDKVQPVNFLGSLNIFVNRAVFQAVGGFSEQLMTGEDKDLCLRLRKAGYDVRRSTETILTHLGYERNLLEFVKKEFWRQGRTLLIAKKWHYSPRTMRNPLLSAWHLLSLVLIVALSLARKPFLALFGIVLWTVPALVISWGKAPRDMSCRRYCQFLFLTFLRWNVAGIALLYQVFHGGAMKKATG